MARKSKISSKYDISSTEAIRNTVANINRIADKAIRAQELQAVYHTIAMRADRRLINIERYDPNKQPELRNIKQYAYRKALSDIAGFFGESDKMRFDRKTKTKGLSGLELQNAINKINAQINSVTNFLDMPSSTVAGLRKTYERSAETLSKNNGISIKWTDLANYFESDVWQSYKTVAPSEVVLKAMYIIKSKNIGDMQNKDFLKFLKDASINVSDENVIQKFKDIDKRTDGFKKRVGRVGKKTQNTLDRMLDSDEIKYSDDPIVDRVIHKMISEGIRSKDIRQQ